MLEPAANDPRHTAIHEAGHAVIGRMLTLACGGATIEQNEEEDEAGHAITADPSATHHQWELREKFRDPSSAWIGRIITFMAGAEAEAEIVGHCEDGDGDDRYQITLMLYEIMDEAEHERREARLRRMARMLVRRHRTHIERVANALQEWRTLSGEEINALVPPTFMERPVTWALALAEDAEAHA